MFRLRGCPEDDTLYLSVLLYSSEQQSIYEIPVLITGAGFIGVSPARLPSWCW